MRYEEVNKIPSFGPFDFATAYEQWVDEAPEGATLVEVGNHYGRSLIYLGLLAKEANKNLKVIGVDLGVDMATKQPITHIQKNNAKEFKVDDIVTFITADSATAAKTFEDESLWLVFIDDDHSPEGFERSFRAWLPKVKKGGVFAGHDHLWHTVWEKLFEIYPTRNHGPTLHCWNIRK